MNGDYDALRYYAAGETIFMKSSAKREIFFIYLLDKPEIIVHIVNTNGGNGAGLRLVFHV